MASLSMQTRQCMKLFTQVLQKLETAEEKHLLSMPHIDMSTQRERLMLWAANIGALQSGKASLDSRLQDSIVVQASVYSFLAKIQELLYDSFKILDGKQIPIEEALEAGCDLGDSDSASESDGSKTDVPQSQLGFNLTEITHQISNLHRMAFRIRNTSYRSTSQMITRALHHSEKDPDTGGDIFEEYAVTDRLRVQGLASDYRRKNGPVENNQRGDFILERISTAMTNRRRIFSYWKRHGEKLSLVSPEGAAPGLAGDVPTNLPSPSQPREALRHDLLTHSVAHHTVISGTEATKFDKSLDAQLEAGSVNSYASTRYDEDGGHVFPPAPKIPEGSLEKHVFQDTQPYVCTYEDCQQASTMYADRNTWQEHERVCHRRIWSCFSHPEIVGPRAVLSHHLREEHHDLSLNQIESIIDLGVASIPDDRTACPICNDRTQPGSAFASHMALHLEKMAMIALPGPLDGSTSSVRGSNDADEVEKWSDNSRLTLSATLSFGTTDEFTREDNQSEVVDNSKEPDSALELHSMPESEGIQHKEESSTTSEMTDKSEVQVPADATPLHESEPVSSVKKTYDEPINTMYYERPVMGDSVGITEGLRSGTLGPLLQIGDKFYWLVCWSLCDDDGRNQYWYSPIHPRISVWHPSPADSPHQRLLIEIESPADEKFTKDGLGLHEDAGAPVVYLETLELAGIIFSPKGRLLPKVKAYPIGCNHFTTIEDIFDDIQERYPELGVPRLPTEESIASALASSQGKANPSDAQ
ncbi:hypothetical protein F4778DRAFT_802467 [Xylariomycetidae sp. FL2044]|nr:hypothetical protein F4778DRAFT_802467 [Xylariomycetidae sp. FL2044]